MCHVMITTPYIFQADCKKRFGNALSRGYGFYEFMKFGPTPHYWLDYLNKVPSNVDENRGVIFLQHAPPLVEFNPVQR